MSKLPRWLLILILVVVLGALITGIVFLIGSPTQWMHFTGIALAIVLGGTIIGLAYMTLPQLIKLYKFNKKMSANEDDLRALGGLLQQQGDLFMPGSGSKVHEATVKFNRLMKDAPDNAYFYYMRAAFMMRAGNNQDAYDAAKSALKLASTDSSLSVLLQQAEGQVGQPTTVAEFKTQMKEMIAELEPKIRQQQAKKEKAVQKRKKKSR